MFGAVQVVHELHPEVTAPSELQTFVPESARARVHCWLVCDGWCRGTVRRHGLLGGSAKAREPRVTHACGAVIFWGAGFTAACAAGVARAVSSCVRGPTIALAAGRCMIVVVAAAEIFEPAAEKATFVARGIRIWTNVAARVSTRTVGAVGSTAHKGRQQG